MTLDKILQYIETQAETYLKPQFKAVFKQTIDPYFQEVSVFHNNLNAYVVELIDEINKYHKTKIKDKLLDMSSKPGEDYIKCSNSIPSQDAPYLYIYHPQAKHDHIWGWLPQKAYGDDPLKQLFSYAHWKGPEKQNLTMFQFAVVAILHDAPRLNNGCNLIYFGNGDDLADRVALEFIKKLRGNENTPQTTFAIEQNQSVIYRLKNAFDTVKIELDNNEGLPVISDSDKLYWIARNLSAWKESGPESHERSIETRSVAEKAMMELGDNVDLIHYCKETFGVKNRRAEKAIKVLYGIWGDICDNNLDPAHITERIGYYDYQDFAQDDLIDELQRWAKEMTRSVEGITYSIQKILKVLSDWMNKTSASKDLGIAVDTIDLRGPLVGFDRTIQSFRGSVSELLHDETWKAWKALEVILKTDFNKTTGLEIIEHASEFRKQLDLCKIAMMSTSETSGGNSGNTKDEAEIPKPQEDGFIVEESRVLYNGVDLELPTGDVVGIASQLIDNIGKVVSYTDLDDNSLAKEASANLRKHKSQFLEKIREHEVPYEIKAKRKHGYILSRSQTIHEESR